MPIVTPDLPRETVGAVSRALAATGRYPSRRGAALSLSSPHPVYTVGLEIMARGRPAAEAAALTGWRALVEEDRKVVAAAEVPVDSGGASINRGAFVDSTVDALGTAESLEMVASAPVELRLLRVPALYLSALWLHGERDVFIALAPAPPPLEAGAVYEREAFDRDVGEMARSVQSAYEAAERPGELGS